MIIKKAKIKDYEQIVDLYKQLYDAEKGFDNNLIEIYKVPDEQKLKIQKRIRSRKNIFLVAEEDNKIIGLIDGFIIDSIYHKEKVGYLDHLCVDINYRKQGVSMNLIEKFSEIMKSKNVAYLKLNAFENNIPAINLYKKLGFEEHSIYYIKKI